MEENPNLPTLEDKFMKSFKYYKSKNPKPSLEDVITVEKYSADKVRLISLLPFLNLL